MIEIEGVRKDMIANNIDPYEPTHPGELIKDEIEYRNISQRQLATEMGVSYSLLNDILNCRRPINIKFAMLCEAALGIPAYLLTRLQSEYEMQLAKRDQIFLKRLKGIKRIAAVL